MQLLTCCHGTLDSVDDAPCCVQRYLVIAGDQCRRSSSSIEWSNALGALVERPGLSMRIARVKAVQVGAFGFAVGGYRLKPLKQFHSTEQLRDQDGLPLPVDLGKSLLLSEREQLSAPLRGRLSGRLRWRGPAQVRLELTSLLIGSELSRDTTRTPLIGRHAWFYQPQGEERRFMRCPQQRHMCVNRYIPCVQQRPPCTQMIERRTQIHRREVMCQSPQRVILVNESRASR